MKITLITFYNAQKSLTLVHILAFPCLQMFIFKHFVYISCKSGDSLINEFTKPEHKTPKTGLSRDVLCKLPGQDFVWHASY